MADDVVLCACCDTPLTADVPRTQMNCLHWCHTRCFYIRLQVAESDIENLPQRYDLCSLCHTDMIPHEWREQADDTIVAFQEQGEQDEQNEDDAASQAEATVTPAENLELSTPQFTVDCKNYVKAVREERAAKISFGKLVSKNSKEFREKTKAAIEMLQNTKKQYMKKIMDSPDYRKVRSLCSKSNRCYTLLERRYELRYRDLRHYLRIKYRVDTHRRRWWATPSWKLRCAFRIRL